MRRLLLAALAACGGGGHHTQDASPYDAATDTLPISGDATANGVSVRITLGGQPVANVATVFLDAQDKQVAAVTTNASGVAAAMVDAGGSVTAVVHSGSGLDHLMTFTAVQPGDMLAIELTQTSPTPSPAVAVTGPTDGASSYTLYPSCGDTVSSPTGTYSFVPLACGATADFVATSTDDNIVINGFLVSLGVQLGETAALTGTFGAPIAQSYGYSTVPSVLASIATRVVMLGHNGPMYVAQSGHPLAGEASFTVQEPMPDTTGLGVPAQVVSNLFPQDSELEQQTLFDVVDSSTPYSVDVTQAMLPRYIAAPAYDVASRSVGWGEAPASAAASFVRVGIHANRTPGGRSWTWQIASAKTATSITFPALPALDGFSYVPTGTDTVGIDELTTASISGGYAGVRAHAFDNLNASATSGRTVIETLFTPTL